MPPRSSHLVPVALRVFLALACAGHPALHGAEQPTPGFELEKVSWTATLPPGTPVTVLNRFGDVRARNGGDFHGVEILVNVQQFDDEGARLEVETTDDEGGATVRVGFRTTPGGPLVTQRDPDQRKRADLTIFVPAGHALVATTDHGLIQAKGVRSDIRATTRSGPVEVRHAGGILEAHTESGNIGCVLQSTVTDRPHVLRSGSGDVSVQIRDDAHFLATLETGGWISTDFSLELEMTDGRRRATAAIGKASSPLSITSESGRVRLGRLPVASRARVRPNRAGPPADDAGQPREER